MNTSRQAEKDFLKRSGSAPWERSKPFAPVGETTAAEGVKLIQDFGAAVALLDPKPHHRILDLGGGGGWAADWLQRLGLSVVSADLSVDLLRIGRERLAASGLARVVGADAEALPFRDGSFDRVLCLNAMHHVPGIPIALAEIARVLGPDGRVVFSEPGTGHAGKAHSRRAVEEFGVQEADIDAAAFLEQCHAAGFAFAVLEPFAHTVTGHGLAGEHWRAWRERADESRPRRAWKTLQRGLLELMGARKHGELFPEAFTSEVLRVLGSAMQDHPIVVASKRPLNRFLNRSGEQPSLRAGIRCLTSLQPVRAGEVIRLDLEIANEGQMTWIVDEARRGHVRVGIQLLDAERRLLNRDHARQALPHEVTAGGRARVRVDCSAPQAGGSYFLKMDLVSEGVSWFELEGSEPAFQALRVN